MKRFLALLVIVPVCFPLTEVELAQFAIQNSYQIKRYVLEVRKSALEARKQDKENSLDLTVSAEAGFSGPTRKPDPLYRDTTTLNVGLKGAEPVKGFNKPMRTFQRG